METSNTLGLLIFCGTFMIGMLIFEAMFYGDEIKIDAPDIPDFQYNQTSYDYHGGFLGDVEKTILGVANFFLGVGEGIMFGLEYMYYGMSYVSILLTFNYGKFLPYPYNMIVMFPIWIPLTYIISMVAIKMVEAIRG